MEKEFVNYSEALALKELGFDKDCLNHYSNCNHPSLQPGILLGLKPSEPLMSSQMFKIGIWNIKAPLYQQTFKFFRENYEIHSYIERLISGAFIYKIDWFEEDRHNKIVWECKSYSFEEAELECLKKLIEIAQKRI